MGQGWASCSLQQPIFLTSPVLFSTLICKRFVSLGFCLFTLHYSWAFPRGFRAGMSLLVAVTVWTSLCWSLLVFAEDISQWKSALCCRSKELEIWKKGSRRVCGSVPSICLILADLKELLSSVWLPHSSPACECSVPVPSAWLVALGPEPHIQTHPGSWRPGAVLFPLPSISSPSFPRSGMTVTQLWTAPTPTDSCHLLESHLLSLRTPRVKNSLH